MCASLNEIRESILELLRTQVKMYGGSAMDIPDFHLGIMRHMARATFPILKDYYEITEHCINFNITELALP